MVTEQQGRHQQTYEPDARLCSRLQRLRGEKHGLAVSAEIHFDRIEAAVNFFQ